MQYKIPQNIDLEDRVVGPLTLVQFLYLLSGGIVIYILFTVIAPVNTILFLAFSVPIGLFSFALAFLKIQDQPFPRFVLAFLAYLFKPKAQTWAKEGLTPELILASGPEKKASRIIPKPIKKSELEKLAQTLDVGGTEPNYRGGPPPPTSRGRPVVDPLVRR